MEDRTFDRISRSLAGATSRRQALKLLGGGIAAGALTTTGLVGLNQAVAAPKSKGSLTAPVTGLVNNITTQGTMTVTGFVNDAGNLLAVGTLVLGAVNEVVSALVTGVTGTCEILDLTIGPIHLDLLGLVVDTNAIHLNITAQSGPGNLLGNLLCAVANLLNGGGPLGALAGLLTRILGALGA
jgi:hypothetical protein